MDIRPKIAEEAKDPMFQLIIQLDVISITQNGRDQKQRRIAGWMFQLILRSRCQARYIARHAYDESGLTQACESHM